MGLFKNKFSTVIRFSQIAERTNLPMSDAYQPQEFALVPNSIRRNSLISDTDH